MISDDLVSSIKSMRAFVPARDFALSRRFYEMLGFQATMLGEQLAHMQLGEGPCTFSFLLQDFYVKAFAENLMMHLLVENLDGWWQHVDALRLHEIFDVKRPSAPKRESWGLGVTYLWDPAGVLWHIAASA